MKLSPLSLILAAAFAVGCGAPPDAVVPDEALDESAGQLLHGQIVREFEGTVFEQGWTLHTPFRVLPGTTFNVTLIAAASDPELFVSFRGSDFESHHDCFREAFATREGCTLTVPAGVTKTFVGVRGKYRTSSYTLRATYTANVDQDDFSAYAVKDGQRVADGTLYLDGKLDAVREAVIRFDGVRGSPTRGQFFAQITIPGSWPNAEGVMTMKEVASLKVALKKRTPTMTPVDAIVEELLSQP
jgi:hypothetical protein